MSNVEVSGVYKEMEQLIQDLKKANEEYYLSDTTSLTDLEYGEKRNDLVKLAEENEKEAALLNVAEFLGSVGAPVDTNTYTAMYHEPPMLSLDNSYDDETLTAWNEKAVSGGSSTFINSPKYDGLAWENVHKEGKLEESGTRGNGYVGENWTATALQIPSIPNTIKDSRVIQTRGEILLSWDSFEEVKEIDGKNYANPRNAAAGIARRKKVGESTKHLDFVVYDVFVDGKRLDTYTESMELVKSLGFTPSEYMVSGSIEETVQQVAKIDSSRATHKYMIDGAVSRVNENAVYEGMGFTSHHPKASIASKFAAAQGETRMHSVVWTKGKKGKISPNARLDTIFLAGTNVSNALLHTMKKINQIGVKIGDVVVVEKAAEIIPQVVAARVDLRDGTEQEIVPPTHCPVCAEPTVMRGEYVYCNNKQCGDVGKNKLLTYVGHINFKGIGPSAAEKLAENGDFSDVTDFYSLTVKKLTNAGVAEKNAVKYVEAIQQSIGTNKPKEVLAGLSIDMCGRGTSEDLIEEGGLVISEMIGKDKQWFEAIANIGPKTAESLSQWFTDANNIFLIEKLYELGVIVDSNTKNQQKESQEKNGASNMDLAFSGLEICITGTLTRGTRNEFAEKIEANGGKFSKSIKKTTHVLLVGDKAGSKKAEAEAAGLTIWTEDEFLAKISE